MLIFSPVWSAMRIFPFHSFAELSSLEDLTFYLQAPTLSYCRILKKILKFLPESYIIDFEENKTVVTTWQSNHYSNKTVAKPGVCSTC